MITVNQKRILLIFAACEKVVFSQVLLTQTVSYPSFYRAQRHVYQMISELLSHILLPPTLIHRFSNLLPDTRK